ncbi:MAG: hypothetical protein ACLGI5_09760 [Thermoleophilia bacterium]
MTVTPTEQPDVEFQVEPTAPAEDAAQPSSAAAIPAGPRIAALTRRRVQLERHLERCRIAAEQQPGPNPSIGRERDDTQSTLALVRAELARLQGE